MNKDETRVYFWVQDFGEDASVVTELIDIEPTFIKLAGQPNPEFPKTTVRWNSWQISSSLPSHAHVNNHLESLVKTLQPRTDAIKTASNMYRAGINCVMYYYEDFTPGIHISEDIIQKISSMNISIDIDLYFLQSKDVDEQKYF